MNQKYLLWATKTTTFSLENCHIYSHENRSRLHRRVYVTGDFSGFGMDGIKDVSGQIHVSQVYFSIVTSSVKYILIYFIQYFDIKRYTKCPTLYHKGQLKNALCTFSLNRTQ